MASADVSHRGDRADRLDRLPRLVAGAGAGFGNRVKQPRHGSIRRTYRTWYNSGMVLSVSISPEAEAALKARAAVAGVDVATYAARHLEAIVASPRSIKEISGPIAEEFARSGMTEDELSDLLETEKHSMRAERRAKRST